MKELPKELKRKPQNSYAVQFILTELCSRDLISRHNTVFRGAWSTQRWSVVELRTLEALAFPSRVQLPQGSSSAAGRLVGFPPISLGSTPAGCSGAAVHGSFQGSGFRGAEALGCPGAAGCKVRLCYRRSGDLLRGTVRGLFYLMLDWCQMGFFTWRC